ncbi:MAG: prohibitin family protein [Microscillaceae bacterium]
MKNLAFAGALLLLMSSCAVVRQDQIGVRRKLGKISDKVIAPGVRVVNPFTTRILRIPTRTVNLEVSLDLPSKEGLTIRSEISILYRVEASQAPNVLRNSGVNYEQVVILPVFRSAVADVAARFFAKDMHTAERATIEEAVKDQMSKILVSRGFIIEAVLLKSIQLPPGLTRAIEEKLEAEQDAQRMEFVLNRERLEADRRMIEAEGIRNAQQIIGQGLTPLIIQFKSIEAFRELATSPNAKTIIVDPNKPMIMNP